jgi:hypothetical protein
VICQGRSWRPVGVMSAAATRQARTNMDPIGPAEHSVYHESRQPLAMVNHVALARCEPAISRCVTCRRSAPHELRRRDIVIARRWISPTTRARLLSIARSFGFERTSPASGVLGARTWGDCERPGSDRGDSATEIDANAAGAPSSPKRTASRACRIAQVPMHHPSRLGNPCLMWFPKRVLSHPPTFPT